jgi:hypothetical protein
MPYHIHPMIHDWGSYFLVSTTNGIENHKRRVLVLYVLSIRIAHASLETDGTRDGISVLPELVRPLTATNHRFGSVGLLFISSFSSPWILIVPHKQLLLAKDPTRGATVRVRASMVGMLRGNMSSAYPTNDGG